MPIADRRSADELETLVQKLTSELEKVNQKQEEHTHRYNRILEGINSILSNVVQAKTEEKMANACLSVALKLTGSLIGFVGLVGDDGQLHDIAISEMGWNQCQMYDKTGHRRPPENLVVHGLYGSVIDTGKGFFTNKPLSHPDSIGLPFGHPPINSFLGVPLVLDGKTMGLIAVADREGGYSYEHQVDLEAIAPAVMHALHNNMSEEALSDAYENLQVHSEELNVSNEELLSQSEQLHESNKALHESEEHYRMLFKNMTEAFYFVEIIYDKEGKPCDYRFLEVNPAYELLMGVKKEQMLGRSLFEVFPNANPTTFEKYNEIAISGKSANFEVFSQAVNNRYLDVYAFSPEKGKLAVIFRDITERKLVEQERETTVAFLRLMNDSKGTADMVHSAVSFFRERSGFEAVGIRLKEGDDYPYFEASGFTEEFIRLENNLCVRDTYGQLYCDIDGYPIHECMCGNIISGRFDPSKPFFTERGSFCSNCTTKLLATTTDADRQARTRNRCNGEGYESVALIALHVGEECFGLLQLNDRRKGQFTTGTISMWKGWQIILPLP